MYTQKRGYAASSCSIAKNRWAMQARREGFMQGYTRKRVKENKDMQQLQVIKDRDGNILTEAINVMGGWKESVGVEMNE